MGLGSFKALGAAHAIAREAAGTGGPRETALSGRIFVTAGAWNHGLSVAAGARLFGACARSFLSSTVPESFAACLPARGAEVVRAGATCEESMAAAERTAHQPGCTLLSDGSWPGYTDLRWRVMQGYLRLAAEAEARAGVAAPLARRPDPGREARVLAVPSEGGEHV